MSDGVPFLDDEARSGEPMTATDSLAGYDPACGQSGAHAKNSLNSRRTVLGRPTQYMILTKRPFLNKIRFREQSKGSIRSR